MTRVTTGSLARLGVLLACGGVIAGPTSAQQSPSPAPAQAPAGAAGAGDAEALAVMLADPIANRVSVPFQVNLDFGIGPENGFKSTLNVQPVIRGIPSLKQFER